MCVILPKHQVKQIHFHVALMDMNICDAINYTTTHTNAFLAGNPVPSSRILYNHKAIKLACAWGTEIIFGILTGTWDAGLVNGNEVVWKISLLVSWQFAVQTGWTSSSHSPEAFQRKLHVPRGTALYPRGSTLQGLSAGLWEDCPQ